jgi:hypothetical protein
LTLTPIRTLRPFGCPDRQQWAFVSAIASRGSRTGRWR